MKNNWQTKRLGEAIKLEYGKPLPKEDRSSNGTFPVYGANGVKDWSKKYFYDKPSIIIGRKGSAGEVTLTKGKFWPLDVTYYVTFDENEYDLKYLFYVLSDLNLQSLARGVKPGINRNDVYSISLKFPPLPEQKRIVAILDEAFANIEIAKKNAEKNVENAREVLDSYTKKIFSNNNNNWKIKKLNQVSQNLDGRRVPITKNKRVAGKFPYYGASGVVDYVDNYIFDEDLLLISEDGANLLARSSPIAFSVSGKIWVNNHAHVIKFKDIFTQKFVEKYLESIKIDQYVTGAAQPKLNQKSLNNISIPFPEIKEQEEVVEKLDQLSSETKALESLYLKKLASLDELKKSILQQAFNGEL